MFEINKTISCNFVYLPSICKKEDFDKVFEKVYNQNNFLKKFKSVNNAKKFLLKDILYTFNVKDSGYKLDELLLYLYVNKDFCGYLYSSFPRFDIDKCYLAQSNIVFHFTFDIYKYLNKKGIIKDSKDATYSVNIEYELKKIV